MPYRIAVRGVVAVILAMIAVHVARAADGETTDGPEVRAERRDGSNFQGALLQNLRLTTDFGAEEIDAKRVRRLTFHPPDDDRAADVVELDDKSLHRGRIEAKTIRFRVDGAPINVAIADLREFKAVRKEAAGFFAIVFGLATLTAMEIVLGVDNVIFLAIVAGRLPQQQQPRARKLGLIVALGTRILLLAMLSFLLGLTRPLFTLPDLPMLHELEAREVSLRDLILLVGGLFLIGKSVLEMHDKFETAETKHAAKPAAPARFARVLLTIAVIDIVFSLDSVITAVGMVDELWVMITAMVLAMLVMMVFAGVISDFVGRYPSLKVLALSFLVLIGVMLTAEGMGQHMDKGYIYFAMAFAVLVEVINLRLGRKAQALPTPAT
jgi:predicted tellurium resistance membrane protein TerC